MKKFRTVFWAVVLVVGLAFLVTAEEKAGSPKGEKPGEIIVEVTEWSGTVKAVDYQKHTVTIEGEGGKTATFNAKHAKNLDQVKVGDKVKAEYIEELAISVRKADASPSAEEKQTVALAPKGKMPEGLIADTIQIQANVEDINYEKRTITLKGPERKVKTFKVDKEVKNFKEIKKGDQVVVRFTESFALAVVRP
jgi:Cu/Ag efflux protein CusF